jgi:hypothetical protein
MAETGAPDVAVGTEPATSATPTESPAWGRLVDQITWYDAQSAHNRRWFKRLKVLQILIAAAIPVAATADAPLWLVGGGGAVIVALEGLQQLQQYQQNWTAYRSTCERLKHEKFLFLAHAGSYASAGNPETLLAERVEGLVSQEHAAWASHNEDETARGAGEAQ